MGNCLGLTYQHDDWLVKKCSTKHYQLNQGTGDEWMHVQLGLQDDVVVSADLPTSGGGIGVIS